jgi:hypothetical protein
MSENSKYECNNLSKIFQNILHLCGVRKIKF